MKNNLKGKITMTLTLKKRILSIIMAAILLTSIIILPVSAASLPRNSTRKTLTGYLGDRIDYNYPIDVYTTGSTAKLRICTFNQNGDRTNGKITVTAVADSGARYTFKTTGCTLNGTTNVTLPKGNTHYEVYITRRGGSNSNRTKTFYFSMDFDKQCARKK